MARNSSDGPEAPIVYDQYDVATIDTLRILTLRGSDPSNRDLTFYIVDPAAHGTSGALNNAPLDFATVPYMPASGFTGVDRFTFQATNGSFWSPTATFIITVTRPLAFSQTVSTIVNTPLTIRLEGSEPTGADMTFIASPPIHGTLGLIDNTPRNSATLTYTPSSTYIGTDTFTFVGTAGAASSLPATVTITVNPATTTSPPAVTPPGPVALTVMQDSSSSNSANRMTFTATDTNAPFGIIWTIGSAATHGTARVESGSPSASGGPVVVSYQPTASYNGADAFAIRVDDGIGGVAIVSVNVIVAPPTAPGTYFVDTNNVAASDNNPGTAALPFKTVQKGATVSGPGDTVIVKAGTYTAYTTYDCVYITNKNGTAASPITIRTYQQPGGAYDHVIFDGGGARQYGIRVSNSSYINIDGFEFTNLACTGISLGRGFWDGTDTHNAPVHHINVTNCLAHHNGPPNTWRGGFEISGPSHDILFERCESHHNGRGFYFGESHQTDSTVLPYQITVRYCLAHFNWLYDNNSDGFTCSGGRSVLLSHCVSHDNSADGITEQGPWADNNIWEYCVAFNGNSMGAPLGDGNGFKIGNINPQLLQAGYIGAHNHIIRNCISFNNLNRGFEDTEGARDSQYYNNVALGNVYWGYLSEGQGAIFKNNIGLQNAVNHRYNGIFGDAVLYGTTTAAGGCDYNFWSDLAGYAPFVTGRHTSYDGAVIEPHSQAGNPLFVSTIFSVDTNLYVGNAALHVPNPNFGQVSSLQLNTGSPCIDTGVNIGQAYPMVGAAYDLGAYEHP